MKKTFDKITAICYEETSPQFLQDIASIEEDSKKDKDFSNAIDEVLETVSIFSDEISVANQNKIQEIYDDEVDSF